MFPPLAGNGDVAASDPADIFNVVLEEIPAQNGRVPMPVFASQLSDAANAEIADYLRTSWNNTAPPDATAPMVAKLRAWPG